MTDTDMTAAPVEFEVEGVTYRLSPLRDKDFGEFERWVQDRYLDVAKRNLEGLGQDDRNALLTAAYKTASSLTISSPESLTLMTTTDGAAYLLYLSLRREHADITFDQAKVLSTNNAVVSQFMSRIRDLNGGDGGAGDGDGDGEEKKRPFVRKKKRAKKAAKRKK